MRLMTREREPHFEGAMKYSDHHLAGLSAGPPDRVEGQGRLRITDTPLRITAPAGARLRIKHPRQGLWGSADLEGAR